MIQFKDNKYLSRVTKFLIFLAVFWIIFLLVRSIWQNFELKHSIWTLNDQIATLEKQKKDLENLNLYYASDSFKELEARKRLGLKKPGESVVILPAASPQVVPSNFPEEINQEKEAVVGTQTPVKISNWLLWWQYFTR